MRRQQRTSLSILVVFAAVTACVMPNITITDPMLQATLQALTIEAAVRGTQEALGTGTASPVPPATVTVSQTASLTASPTLTAVPSLTPTATWTPTQIVVASPTPVVPSISVSVPTNCRSGPGREYPVEGYLLVGELAQVMGRDPSGNYWYIPNPDSPGDYCWVWGGYATLSGLSSVFIPILTPPPTPTPTMTATPSPSFEASYEGVVWCTGAWWIEIGLENTGPLTFRSWEMTVRDVQLDISVAGDGNGFVDRPDCSSSTSRVTLQGGKSLSMSSPSLDNDPNGHKMRINITLCSKEDQQGECVSQTMRFTP